jgi:hypothetical protein
LQAYTQECIERCQDTDIVKYQLGSITHINPHILASLEFLPGQGTFSSSENGEMMFYVNLVSMGMF